VRAGPVVVFAVAIAGGCQQRTELVIGIVTDLQAPNELDLVELVVDDGTTGVPLLDEQFTISGRVDVPSNLPGSYGLLGDGQNDELTLDLRGFAGSALVVERTSIVSLVADQTLFYRMALASLCDASIPGSLMMDCGSGQTCQEGTCVGNQFDAKTFPAFETELVDNLTCDSGTAYIDTDSNAPMTTIGSGCGSGACHEGTCYKP
jgi:hypothetical protein